MGYFKTQTNLNHSTYYSSLQVIKSRYGLNILSKISSKTFNTLFNLSIYVLCFNPVYMFSIIRKGILYRHKLSLKIVVKKTIIFQPNHTWHHRQQFELDFGPVIVICVTDLDCHTFLRGHHRSGWVRDCLVPAADVRAQYDGRVDIAAITNCHMNVAGQREDPEHQQLSRRGGEGLDDNIACNSVEYQLS